MSRFTNMSKGSSSGTPRAGSRSLTTLMARSCGATRAGSSLMSPREPCESSRNPLGKRMARPTLAEGRGELDLAALNRPSATRPLLLASMAFAFLVVLYLVLGALIIPGAIITDDVRVHVYWMRRFQDPELFRDDLLTEFATAPFFAKKGFTFLYYLASYFIDPVTFCAVLPLVLVPVTAYYLFRLGALIKDNVTATSLVLLYLPLVWARITGGLQRDFALPLFVPFLYYLICQRYVIVLVLLTLQALFYPPALLVSLGVFAFCAIELKGRRLRVDRRKAGYLALGLLLAFAVLAPDYLWYHNERLGPMVTRAQTLQMPEFHAGGHHELLKTTLLDSLVWGNLLHQRPLLTRLMNLVCFLALLILASLWRGTRWRLPKEILALPLSAVAMFGIGCLLWPTLYLPTRYIWWTIPLFLVIFVAANFLPAANVWVEFSQGKRLFPPSPHAPGLLLVAFLLSAHLVAWRKAMASVPFFPELCQYLKTLPKNVLIAGHPQDMSWIPTCARRKVLVNEELTVAFYQNYYREVRQRTLDFFDAYYANSPGTIRQFTERYGIDYLVVDEADFPREGRVRVKPLFEPFRGYVRALIPRNAPGGFPILDYPYGQVVWRDKGRFVLNVSAGTLRKLQKPSGQSDGSPDACRGER